MLAARFPLASTGSLVRLARPDGLDGLDRFEEALGVRAVGHDVGGRSRTLEAIGTIEAIEAGEADERPSGH